MFKEAFTQTKKKVFNFNFKNAFSSTENPQSNERVKILKEMSGLNLTSLKDIEQILSNLTDDVKNSNFYKLSESAVRLFLMKNPGRQNIEEKTAHELLKNSKIFSLYTELPNKGKDSIRITRNGKLKYGKKENGDLKSFDGYAQHKHNNSIYISLKRTKNKGGAQDLVKMEIELTAECCSKNKDGHLFIFLCDLDFWETKDSNYLKEKFKKYNNIIIYQTNKL